MTLNFIIKTNEYILIQRKSCINITNTFDGRKYSITKAIFIINAMVIPIKQDLINKIFM